MAAPTGTLEWLNQFLSDTPTDMNVINTRVTVIAKAISQLAEELNKEAMQIPGLIDESLEKEMLARIEPLNRELERLLAAKRRLEAEKR